MTTPGTEKALTVDANVIDYYFIAEEGGCLPEGCGVTRIEEFRRDVIQTCPIAINDHIRVEYEQTCGLERVKNWLKERNKNDLPVIEVKCARLAQGIGDTLERDYHFRVSSRDRRYLETCYNTIFKHLITEDSHFFLEHRASARRPMNAYLHRELGICVCRVDECCRRLLHSGEA